MAKTLQEILDPKLIPKILEALNKPDNIHKLVSNILSQSMRLHGYTRSSFISRGDGKTYVVMS